MDVLALYPKCPHCGRKIGFFNRIEHCAYSDELVCNKCIVSGRFSDSVVDKIPSEYREKFRFFNVLPWIVVMITALLLIQSGWYRFGGWAFSDLDLLLNGVIYLFVMIFSGIIVILLSILIPHLGTWMFYWWISKPKNRKKIEDAVVAMDEGRYQSSNKIYSTKNRIVEWLKSTNLAIVLYPALVLNLAMIAFFFIMNNVDSLAGTYFSAIVGIIWVLVLILNFLVILIAAGFYSRKSAENKKNKAVIELFSWSYAFSFPFIFFPFILGKLWELNAMEELIKPLVGIDFGWTLIFYQIVFVAQSLLIVGLVLFLKLKGKPVYELKPNIKAKERKLASSIIKQVFKTIITLVFFSLLLVGFFLSLLMLIVDPAMALGIVSPTYILVGLFIPIIFAVLKLVERRPKKYTQFFWTCLKISVIVIGVCSAPAVLTPTSTNWYLEEQFDASFGTNWESKIDPELSAKFRDVPYSAYENFFGFQISYESEWEYDVVYGADHPRYVKDRNTGEILSNGSSKYTERLRNFTFDAYLPPDEQFGQGLNKYPVLIFCHGIGMDKGTGNANFSVARYFANQGYLVCDMEYGRTGWVNNDTIVGNRGYDFPDTVRQVANFTKFLEARADYYHADLNNVYFAGRSFGGWMATILAYGHNMTFFAGDFAASLKVRGCIPFYGAVGVAEAGELLTLDILGPDGLDMVSTDAPYIRGSPDPESEDYNPEWFYFNTYEMIDPDRNGGTQVCPTLIIQGTQDVLVTPGWSIKLKDKLESYGHIGIAGLYPLGSHATDVIHWSHYGQSILYYMERFLGLTVSV